MTTTLHAPWAGPATPTNDEAPAAVGAARGFRDQDRNASPDSAAASAADQVPAAAVQQVTATGHALQAIAGECRAAEYLARLRAEQAAPDELALTVAPLYGASLRGFCRAIEKALLGPHHA